MSDPHRGAYTPNSDAPLSFDARQPVRGGGQPPLTLLISAGILLVLVIAIFFVYRGGVRGADDAPRPVGAPVGNIKDAAPAEADKADPAAGLQIYKTDEDGAAVAPTFAPVVVAKPPLVAPQPLPVTTATPRPSPPQTIAAAAGSAVQIGAFSTQAQADSGWTAAARVAPGLAAGKGKSVQAIDSNGKTLYRTAVTGFETRSSADAFCSALKAAGKSCFVR